MREMVAASLAITGAFALVLFVMYYIGTAQRRYLIVVAGWAVVVIAAIWIVGMTA